MTIFFGILALMFLLLGISPKESKYMFGKSNGMKKSTFVITSVIAAFVCFAVVMITLQPTESDSDTNHASQLQGGNGLSFSDWSEQQKEKSVFLDKHIVFVIGGFDNYYYTYDQMVYVTQALEGYEFWAYNTEQAISLNYVASNINITQEWSSEKAKFLDERIVFVIDGFGNYYYTYDEMISVTQQLDEFEFWAYNTEQAISLGYKHHSA